MVEGECRNGIEWELGDRFIISGLKTGLQWAPLLISQPQFCKLKNFENILPALMITASHWAVRKLFAFLFPLKIDGFYLQFTISVLLVVSHVLLALFINDLF